MAARVEFDGSEIRGLADDLERAGARATTRTRVVIEKTGYDTVAGSQAICPVLTGHLKGSIGVDFDGDGLGFEAGTSVRYGGFVHFGTSRMSPQPFLLPVFDRQVDAAMDALEQVAAGIFDT